MALYFSANIWYLIVSVIGGLGLVLLALRLLSESLQFLFGAWIRWALSFMSKNIFISALSGLLVALFVQSGIATTFMGVGFAGSGLFSLNQLMAFLLGSNLGTALTSVLFLLPRGYFELYLLGVGALPMFYAPQEWLSQIGRGVFSVGLLLLGYGLLSSGFTNASLSFLNPVYGPSSALYWELLVVAALVAALLRSSIAMLGLVMAALSAQVITVQMALAMVLGINVGTALPAFLVSLDVGTNSKRGSFFHFFSNLAMAVVVSLAFEDFVRACGAVAKNLGHLRPSLLLYVPISHVLFNVSLVFLFLLLLWPTRKVIEWVFPKSSANKEPQKLTLLGHFTSVAPTLALEQAVQEIKKMSAMVESVLQLTHELVTKGSLESEQVDRIFKYESITDKVHVELNEFLQTVMQSRLSLTQSQRVQALLRLTHELESIADKSRFVVHRILEMNKQGLVVSTDNRKNLAVFFESILADYELVFVRLTEAQSASEDQKEDPLAKFNDDRYTSRVTTELLGMHKLVQSEPVACVQALGDIFVALAQIRLHTQNVFQAYQRL
ncbi:MAG: Na/Pi cotransporter family protein [Bdellovibrionales bacterium]|nr:Na/Pi cotransporter family protein [Bdellovibrionales bacterium]